MCRLLQSRLERPSRGFREQGKKGIYFRGTGEQRPNFEGNRGTKTILKNREYKETNFRFLGNRGTSQFISGEQGNRYPPWEGLIGALSDCHTLLDSTNGRVLTDSKILCPVVSVCMRFLSVPHAVNAFHSRCYPICPFLSVGKFWTCS